MKSLIESAGDRRANQIPIALHPRWFQPSPGRGPATPGRVFTYSLMNMTSVYELTYRWYRLIIGLGRRDRRLFVNRASDTIPTPEEDAMKVKTDIKAGQSSTSILD
jgi:hypothetical protein